MALLLRITALCLATLLLGLGWLIFETKATRREFAAIHERLLLTQIRATMATQFTTTIDCCGDPLEITTTGATITEHLQAVRDAKQACKDTCR